MSFQRVTTIATDIDFMIPSNLFDVAQWGGGALIAGVPAATMTKISSDTRSIQPGDTFLALKGENFNGHDFLGKAIEAGASSLIVSELPAETESYSGNIIHVRNTLKALQEIALNYRRKVISDLFVVGVTGSNGKTSTKDFLNAVLSQAGKVNATKGNLNNHIGLPMTVLDTESEDRFGIWEMGMNHPGEISPLAEIANPDAAVITNVGTAHIEHMKTREAIAREKGALARAIGKDGFCVMPATDDYFDFIASQVRCEMIGVGGEKSLVRADDLQVASDGISFTLWIDGETASVSLPVPGRHMVMNSLLAAAVGYRKGISIDQIAAGLSATKMTGGRLEKDGWNGISILNDSYNANPDSVKAALLSLTEVPSEGRKIAVLGFMGELGEHEESAHHEVGAYATEVGVDLLVTVSEKAALIGDGAGGKIKTEKFESHEAAASYLKGELATGDTLLVKGSRAARMETVIDILKKN
ncbi:MAG: UDP-N-acetylmuramoyl-tripeptide--D-alanyl-D-alanine ligase [Verrucomicrobiales bacterium]|nr:UDP-N-acetylmuramoyl-tripeptide--D-alanyl-D-alanine ligase [Verrucomicrobiales bacterium]